MHAATTDDLRSSSLGMFRGAGYTLCELLQRDSLFELWRVRHLKDDSEALWKQPRPEWLDSTAARQLLSHEERVLLAVDSPYLAKILAPSDSPLPGFLLLEGIHGRTLENLLRTQPKLSLARAVWIARQIAQGLADLQSSGFLHGDLQPRNVLLTTDGRVQLLGLTIASPLTRCLPEFKVDFPMQEHLQSDLESTQYRAPERTTTGRIVPRTGWDLYSLGVILYQMLTGTVPLDGPSIAELEQRQRGEHAIPLRCLAPTVPVELESLVHELLAKQPLRRPESWRSVIDRLVGFEIGQLRYALDRAA